MSDVPTIVMAADVPPARLDVMRQAAAAMWRIVAQMLAAEDLAIPAVRVVLSDDVIASAATEGEALELPPDRRTGSDRLGGMVGGKALRSNDGAQASVLVHADQLRGDGGIAEFWTSTVIAHEFGHLYYAAVRDKYRGSLPDAWLPWEMAGMMGLLAAEEFRVDRLGVALVQTVVQIPVNDTGSLLTVTDVVDDGYLEGLRHALPAVVPGLLSTIHAYRTHRLDLETMWSHVARTSEEAMLLLAHADAHQVGDLPVLDVIGNHPAVALLKPLWAPIRDYLRGRELFPEPDEWQEDAKRLQTLGRIGWMQAWERLGLRPRPEGDVFYLAVGEPTL